MTALLGIIVLGVGLGVVGVEINGPVEIGQSSLEVALAVTNESTTIAWLFRSIRGLSWFI